MCMNERKESAKEGNNRSPNREVVCRLSETMCVKHSAGSQRTHFFLVVEKDGKYQDWGRELEASPGVWSLRL